MTSAPDTPPTVWTHAIASAARACEAFFWRLAWFTVIICFLCNYNPFKPATTNTDQSVTDKRTDADRFAIVGAKLP